ncbi:MAG: hypothetical protein JW976_14615 [Syntrophaceae bacterium]|nr:hypothetical protein [Syntrophaceae bacterium]
MSNGFNRKDIIYTISARGKHGEMPVMNFLARSFSTIPLNQIDSLFGFVERCTLYGGRPFVGRQLSDADIQALYKNSIGVRIPMTNLFISEDEYKEYSWLFEKYHRDGNSMIVKEDTLARWIRRDYPKYKLEASMIKEIDTYDKITAALDIYDMVVLPMHLNTRYDFLDKIAQKERVMLFANAGCAYNCPARICYRTISLMNKLEGTADRVLENSIFRCSKMTRPRKELGMVDFDLDKLSSLGFKRFKLLRERPEGITAF